MIDEKAPRAAPSFAQQAIPNLTKAYADAGPAITDAYKQSGVGGAIGQTVRETGNYVGAGVQDLARSGNTLMSQVAEPIIRPAAQALKTAVTGDASPIGAEPAVVTPSPAVAAVSPAKAQPAAQQPAAASPMAALASDPVNTRINDNLGPDYSWMARNAENQKKADADKKAYDASPQGMMEAQHARLAAQSQAAADGVPKSAPANTGVGWIDALVNNRNLNRDREATLKAQQPFLQAQAGGTGDAIRSLVQQGDPLHQAQTKVAQQAGATGDLVAKAQAVFADPNATEEQRSVATSTLRDLMGKYDDTKIASEQTMEGTVPYAVRGNSAVKVSDLAASTSAKKNGGKRALPKGHTPETVLAAAKKQLEKNPTQRDAINADLKQYGLGPI